MRLIDVDTTIPMIKYATTDNEIGVFPIKIGFNDIVKVLNAQPTVDAIPVEWINKYTNEHRTYMYAFSEMVACWYNEKERREYEMTENAEKKKMNYCVKHNEQCNSADAGGHCSLTACNRYLLITDENYLEKLTDMQTQIKELIPDPLKENEYNEYNDYIQGDRDHNIKVALRRLKEVCWKNNLSIKDKKEFAKAQEIIISTLAYGDYDIVRK